MDLQFLPQRLVTFCNGIVERHHKRYGYSGISQFIWDKDIMGFIAIHEDLFALLQAATTSWKLQITCLVLASAVLIMATFASWWIVLGVIPALLAARYFAKRTTNSYILISALMLSLEMSGNDVGGLASRLPSLHETANARLQDYLGTSRTRFLDYYLPRRDEIPAHAVAQLADMLVET